MHKCYVGIMNHFHFFKSLLNITDVVEIQKQSINKLHSTMKKCK